MTVKLPKRTAIKVAYEVVLAAADNNNNDDDNDNNNNNNDDDDDNNNNNNNNNNNKLNIKCDKIVKNVNITTNYLTTDNSTFAESDKL
jgi:hypothetical protein